MIATWLNEIVDGVRSFTVGMGTTWDFFWENVRRTPGGAGAITLQYPVERPQLGERYRGHLHNRVADCITCNLCAKACPVDCFVIDGERTEDNKLRPSRFDIDLTKCIYCGLCTRVCPTDCLTMTTDYEVAPDRMDPKRAQLFLQTPAQSAQRLDEVQVARLERITRTDWSQLSQDDKDFLATHESPEGKAIIALYGVGYYTAEHKAEVEAIREERKKAKAAADAVAAAAKKAAADAAAAPKAAP